MKNAGCPKRQPHATFNIGSFQGRATRQGRWESRLVVAFANIIGSVYEHHRCRLEIIKNKVVTLLEWWNGLSENQVALAVPFIAAVLMAAGYLAKRWFEKPSPPANPTMNTASDRSIIQHTDGGTAVVYTGDVIIGLPQAEYEKRLKQREDEITAHLKEGHANERILLEHELDAVQQRLQDIKASYQEHSKDLRERIAQLESLRGQVSDTLLSQAQAALARDDTKQADDLFRKVEEQTASAVKVAAEAAYQRCRIAYAAIQYRPALRHCQRAVQLAPENLVYLSSAGELAHILAQHRLAIGYLEQALASDLKTYGEAHPRVATGRNNLGGAWKDLGEYDKSIGYLEQAYNALRSSLGEKHPWTKEAFYNLSAAKVMLTDSHPDGG